MTRPKYRQHPLIVLFNNKRLDHTACMNLLQDMGLVSSNAVTVHDVAHCDALDVLRRVEAPWAKMYFQVKLKTTQ